jgi:hypothetical protein
MIDRIKIILGIFIVIIAEVLTVNLFIQNYFEDKTPNSIIPSKSTRADILTKKTTEMPLIEYQEVREDYFPDSLKSIIIGGSDHIYYGRARPADGKTYYRLSFFTYSDTETLYKSLHKAVIEKTDWTIISQDYTPTFGLIILENTEYRITLSYATRNGKNYVEFGASQK